MRLKSTSFVLLVMIASLSLGCSSTQKNIERGGGYTFRLGYPEIRLSAIGVINDEDQPIINTATELVINSLIFKKDGEERIAEVLLELKVINKENGSLNNYSETIRIDNKDTLIGSSADSYQILKNFQVEPGTYEIYATVTDLSSQKDISTRTETSIPDPEKPEVSITPILLLTKDNDNPLSEYFPTTTYDVSSKMDSLRFEFQATNNDSNEPLVIRARLIRFETDTLPALPMSFVNYSPGSLRFKGINYRRDEEISSTTRLLIQPGSVFIEFSYPNLDRGNYRFEVTTESGSDENVYQGRDFSIKSKNYPALSSVYELAAPLVYLMNEKDHGRLMKIKDPAKLKLAVDRFWLGNIGNPNVARQVIQKYYDRVEQANKLFSTYKEGWKTDMGMMYILFGPPVQIFKDINRVMWSYTTNLYDPETNFYFANPKVKSSSYPFENYIFQRDNFYFNVNYQQIRKWKSGTILTDRL